MGILQEIEVAGGLGRRLLHYRESTPSTNTLALALGRAGALAGSVVLAEGQSAGRGRLGKSFLSPAGDGLYFSLLWRSRLAPEDLAKITLAAGLAACLALEEGAALQPRIKWPNDLLLGGRKVGGILVESDNPGRSATTLVIVGLGLNVSTSLADFPPELRERASSLLVASGRLFSRGALLLALLRQLERVLERMENGDFAAILEEWRSRDGCRKAMLRWLAPGGEIVCGRSLGPDANGLLHIEGEDGTIYPVLSGDLALDPAALPDFAPYRG